MAADGYFHEDDRFELVGGDIVPMSPKSERRHEIIRTALAFRFCRAAPERIFVASLPRYNLAEDTFLLPDVLVHPAAVKTFDLQGKDALLVVEVAESSLAYDNGTKARLYASHGVREYWMINAGDVGDRDSHQSLCDGIRRHQRDRAQPLAVAKSRSDARNFARVDRHRLKGKVSNDLILRAVRKHGVSKDGPMRCGLWPSFETPASQAPQDEVTVG